MALLQKKLSLKKRMRKSHGNNARTLIKTFNVNPVHSGNCLCKTYLVSCDLYFRIYISRNCAAAVRAWKPIRAKQ